MAIKHYYQDGKKFYEVYVSARNSQGKRFQRRLKKIKTLRRAQSLEFEIVREAGKFCDSKMTYRWSEWLEICLARMKIELLPSTVASYNGQLKKWISPHWDSIEINSISKPDVYDLIFQKCEGFKTQYTRRNILKMLKRIFQMAVEEGYLDRNPCTGIGVKVSETALTVLTTSEVEIFLSAARSVQHRFYPVWVVGLLTGMRSGEMFALKWTDIDFEGRMVSVSKAWNSKCGITPTKSKRTRVVPISDDLLSFLKELKLQSAEREHVLPRLTEWEHGDQSRIIKEFCTGLRITPIRFHDLRATFITNLLARGESLARVMSMVGHSELKTTNGYLRKAGVDVQGATEKLGYKLPTEYSSNVVKLRGRE